MNKVATILLCVNFVTVLFPQPGYIHPDEFFQSSEIVAGDVLGVAHERVWEFNSSFPVRSIVFPYLVTAPPLYLLKWINSTGYTGFQLSAVKVVMATRLPLAFLSVFGYLATGKLADCFHIDRYVSTILYCSSYVSWTYYTRTFSNSIESVLLAIVLLLTLSCSGTQTLLSSTYLSQAEKEEATSEDGDKQAPESDKEMANPDKEANDSEKTVDDKEDSDVEKEDSGMKDSEMKNTSEGKKDAADGGDQEVESDKMVTANEDKKEDKGKQTEELTETKTDSESGVIENVHVGTNLTKSISFFIGVVIAAGFFNRPTFLVFAFMPTVYWLWSLSTSCHQARLGSASLLSHIFNITLGASLAFVAFVLLDTMYFNPEFMAVLSESLNVCIDSHFSAHSLHASFERVKSALVVTPWNFVMYNMDSSNLAKHGLHPRFLHFFVNLPLLLGPLYIPFVIVCIASLFHVFRKAKRTSQFRSVAWLTFMALVPILCLSVFPHQEPRFLIPALPVLVVMGTKIVAAMAPARLSFLALWTVFNILLTLMYGYMHQAALVPALSIFQQKLSSSFSGSSGRGGSYHAIFYKTYPPPRHLLLLDPSNSYVSIHELAGAPMEVLVQTIATVKDVACREAKNKCQVHVFLPSTVTPRLMDLLPKYKVRATSICPHLSMEAPPRFKQWWKRRVSFDEFIMDFCLNVLKIT